MLMVIVNTERVSKVNQVNLENKQGDNDGDED